MSLRQLSPCTTEKMKEQLGYKTRVVDKLENKLVVGSLGIKQEVMGGVKN